MGNKSLNYLLKRRRYNVCTMYLCSAAKNAPGVPRGVKERPWGPFLTRNCRFPDLLCRCRPYDGHGLHVGHGAMGHNGVACRGLEHPCETSGLLILSI